MIELKDHWNSKYASTPFDKLGWYEEFPGTSMQLIGECSLPKGAHLFIAGAGSSLLIDFLLDAGYTNITACDLSEVALSTIRQRLGSRSELVNWLVADLSNPADFESLPGVDYWHDRAVLHFFTHESDRKAYFDIMDKHCKPGARVMLAAFSKDEEALKCSNLPVFKYDSALFRQQLGSNYREIKSFHDSYTMPSGDRRDYIYALYEKISE